MQNNLPEAFAKTQAANFEFFTAVGHAVINGLGEVAPLAVEAARGALNEAATFATTLQAAKTPQDVVNVYSNFAETARESATAFSRSAYDLAVETQTKLQRLLDAYVATSQEAAHDLVEKASANVPTGATGFVDAFKQFAAAGNNSYAEITKTLRNVADVAVAKTVPAAVTPVARKGKASA